MKKLVILGAGTAGTMMLNKLFRELNPAEWNITIVDDTETHYYQPVLNLSKNYPAKGEL